MEPTRQDIDDRWQALVDGRASRASVHEWAAQWVTARPAAVHDELVQVGLRHLYSFEQAWDSVQLGRIVYGGPGVRLTDDASIHAALGRWRARCHGASTYRLPVRNVGDEPVCLMLEPLGEDFWLQPGEKFIVVGEEFDAQFEIESMPGYVIVGVMAGDCRNVRVIDAATNAVLPCGHGRAAPDPAY